MGFTCGLVGLPNAGKTTIFNALTSANAVVAPYPFCTISPNKGIVEIPDERLINLSNLLKPEKVTPTYLEVMDIAGLVQGASKGEGLGNQFLSHIREVDAILHVVRCFESKECPHITGKLDPIRDIEIVKTELLLADLEMVEKRILRVRKASKADPKQSAEEIDFLEKMMGSLARGIFVNRLIDQKNIKFLHDLFLLTIRPILYVANTDRSDKKSLFFVEEIERYAKEEGNEFISIDGKLESEIAQLNPDERYDFIKELDGGTSALERLLLTGYRVLNLLTFYTIKGTEIRAWTLKKGSRVITAAGKIHSDMEKGFIKAEIVPFDVLIKHGSITAIREKGILRIEGRDYIVNDGDIITIRFNI